MSRSTPAKNVYQDENVRTPLVDIQQIKYENQCTPLSSKARKRMHSDDVTSKVDALLSDTDEACLVLLQNLTSHATNIDEVKEMIVRQLNEKNSLIHELKCSLIDVESQNTRLRSLRRGGVDSPVSQVPDKKLNQREKLLAISVTPKSPRTPKGSESPASTAFCTGDNKSLSDLVLHIERLQKENFVLNQRLANSIYSQSHDGKMSASETDCENGGDSKWNVKKEPDTQQVDLHNLQVKTLEQELAQATLELMDVRKLNVELQEKIDGLTSSITMKEVKEKNLEQELYQMISQLQDVQKLNSELKEAVTDLTNSNIEGETEVKSLKEKLAQVNSQFEDIEKQNQDLKESLSSSSSVKEEEMKRLSDKYAETVAQYEKLQKHNQELNKANEQKSALIKQLQSELNDTKVSESKLTGEIDVLDLELSNSKSLLESKTRELDKSQSELLHCKAQLEKSLATVQELKLKIKQYENKIKAEESQMKEEVRILMDAKQCAASSYNKQFDVINSSCHQLRSDVVSMKNEFNVLRQDYASLSEQYKADFQAVTSQIASAVLNTRLFNEQLILKYKKEISLRKNYYNQIVQLKGNIRVLCRVRPVVTEDSGSDVVLSCDEIDDGIIRVNHRGREQIYECDKVFNMHSSQSQMYGEVEDVVLSCLDGYHVCIFAYGQTGSGKTYTMEGTVSNPGINQRALSNLFEEMRRREPDWSFTLSLCMLEIYNESLRDLLCKEGSMTPKLEVKMTAGGGLEVPGLTWAAVTSTEDIQQLFMLGQLRRTKASTNMNSVSSRSHSLLCVNIKGLNSVTGTTTFGKLNLIDLAGSERVSKSGAEGERLNEAKYINKSLSALGDVIHALRSRQSHIPYRNSSLTYLLQDSLGGDSKTVMIAQVSPVEKNVGETIATLSFAQRARSVECGEASKRTKEVLIGYINPFNPRNARIWNLT